MSILKVAEWLNSVGLVNKMLVEEERIIPEGLLKSARPWYGSNRKEKPTQVVSIDGLVIQGNGFAKTVDTLFALVEFVLETNTIVTNDIIDFHRFLSQICDCGTLFNERSVEENGHKLSLSDVAGAFFTVRKGNTWGSIYCPEEIASLEDGEFLYHKQLELIHEAGWHLDRLMPPAKMAEHLIKQTTTYSVLPNFSKGDIDIVHTERAYNAFRGSRMEAVVIGSFDNVFSMDLNSAFMSVMREVPAISPAFVKWVDTKEYQKDAVMGFVECETYIPEDSPIGWLATRVDFLGNFPRLFFSVGRSCGWRTKEEVDFIKKTGCGEIEIFGGSWAIPLMPLPKPFDKMSRILERLMKNEFTRDMAKYVAATSWGKFISPYPGNSLWNPFYASVITARIRIKLAEIAALCLTNLIALTIDGVELTRDLDFIEDSSDDIGGVKKKERGHFLSLSDYYRYDPDEDYTWDLDDAGVLIKSRKTLPYVMRYGGDVGEVLPEVLVPFGSSKRSSPDDLTLRTIEGEQFYLLPPTPEDCVTLYYDKWKSVPSRIDF